MKNFYILLCVFFLLPLTAIGQFIEVDTTVPDEELIQSLGGSGVTISNINIIGSDGSYGAFTEGAFGFSEGVLLTTGLASQAVGPNISTNTSTNTTAEGHPLLDGLSGGASQDATVVTFDILTQGCTLSFDYVFASEEYHEFVNTAYNDAFGIFITGPDIDIPENLAVLPVPGAPPVSINTVNAGNTMNCSSNPDLPNGPNGSTNVGFFVDNCTGLNISYDGRTRALTAFKSGLIVGEVYTITIAIGDVFDGIRDSGVFISAGSFDVVEGIDFHFEDAAGNEEEEFCIGEDVFLDATTVPNPMGFTVELGIVDEDGNIDWISDTVWPVGSPGILNVTSIFENDPQDPVVFEWGVTYAVRVITSGPECDYISAIHEFTYILCCEEFTDPRFQLDINASQNGYDLIAKNFETYNDINAAHDWYILSSPNEGSGPYTPVHSTTTIGSGPVVIFDNAQYGLYYTVIHKAISDCGELCYAREQYQSTYRAGVSLSRASEDENVDCCLAYEYWPDGVGEPEQITAEFTTNVTPVAVAAFPVNTYPNVPGITHEWILLSSISPNGGTYTFVDAHTGPNYVINGLQSHLYYFLIHKVKSDCGEVCYAERLGLDGDCELCGPIDCSIASGILLEECQTAAPTNLQSSGTTLTWNAVPGAVSYTVTSPSRPRITCPCDSPLPISLNVTTLTNSLALPTVGLEDDCFVWQVIATCSDGTSSVVSDQACYMGGDGFGNGDDGQNDRGVMAEIWPNPSNGNMELRLTTPYDTELQIEIFDFSGRPIQTFTREMKSLDTKSIQWNAAGRLHPGVYFIHFKTSKETLYKKFIIK